MDGKEIAIRKESACLKPEQVLEQVNLIQHVMSKVMQDKVHYGTIPGCGDKPTLLKPGAEKLLLTFRLASKYEVVHSIESDTMIMYRVRCDLVHINSGNFVGSGEGACNSKESKYRYRTENTGKEVPKEYWEKRDSSLLGGSQFSTRKNDGTWWIMHKVEHDNHWDNQNTILKMAEKRALVAAILNATAASDIFTQDIEDMPHLQTQAPKEEKAQSSSSTTENGGDKVITVPQLKLLNRKMADKKIPDEAFLGYFGIESMEALPFSQMSKALDAIDKGLIGKPADDFADDDIPF